MLSEINPDGFELNTVALCIILVPKVTMDEEHLANHQTAGELEVVVAALALTVAEAVLALAAAFETWRRGRCDGAVKERGGRTSCLGIAVGAARNELFEVACEKAYFSSFLAADILPNIRNCVEQFRLFSAKCGTAAQNYRN